MWIDTNLKLPKERGYYKCLVIQDGFNTLEESSKELFNGKDWDLYESHCQYISHWWSNTDEPLNEIQEDFDRETEELENLGL